MRLSRMISFAAILFFSATSAQAAIEATFTGTAPAQDVTYSLAGTGFQDIRYGVGPLNFDVNSSTDPRFAGSFSSFCAALTESVATNQSAIYNVVSSGTLNSVGGSATKVGLLQDLFDKFYDQTNTATGAAAFQVALWEVITDGNGSLSLTSGDFTAKDGDSIPVANNWLASLSSSPAGPKKYDVLGLYSKTSQDQLIGIPTNPIPAPPAVVLGLVACGIIGLRRRMNASKAIA